MTIYKGPEDEKDVVKKPRGFDLCLVMAMLWFFLGFILGWAVLTCLQIIEKIVG